VVVTFVSFGVGCIGGGPSSKFGFEIVGIVSFFTATGADALIVEDKELLDALFNDLAEGSLGGGKGGNKVVPDFDSAVIEVGSATELFDEIAVEVLFNNGDSVPPPVNALLSLVAAIC